MITETASTTSHGRPKFPHSLAPAMSGAVLEIQRLLASQASFGVFNEDLLPAPPSASVIWVSMQASSFDLQRFALARLAAIRNGGDAQPSRAALESLNSVIHSLVADNGPTPQVGATPEGSVEVQWLVDGNMVSALFDASGEYNIYAADENDAVLVDNDVAAGPLPPQIYDEVSAILATMSRKLVCRPPSWAEHG